MNNAQYVFVQPFGTNNSYNWQNGITTSSINTVGYSNDTFVGSDSTSDLKTVSMTSSSGYLLLATLIVSAPTNDVDVNDIYTLNLNIGSGNTFFDQYPMPGTGVTVDSDPSGQVMIIAASVPEPSSIVYGPGRRPDPCRRPPDAPLVSYPIAADLRQKTTRATRRADHPSGAGEMSSRHTKLR